MNIWLGLGFVFVFATKESYLLDRAYLPFTCSVSYQRWRFRASLLWDEQRVTSLVSGYTWGYLQAVRGECSPSHFPCCMRQAPVLLVGWGAAFSSPENPEMSQEILITHLPMSQPDKYSSLRNVDFNCLVCFRDPLGPSCSWVIEQLYLARHTLDINSRRGGSAPLMNEGRDSQVPCPSPFLPTQCLSSSQATGYQDSRESRL